MKSPEKYESENHKPQPEKTQNDPRQLIEVLADIRRRRKQFQEQVASLRPPPIDVLRARHEAKLGEVLAASSPERGPLRFEPPATLELIISSLMGSAEKEQNPVIRAWKYAQASDFLQRTNHDPGEALRHAREALDHTKDIPKITPSDLLPEAMILGVQERIARSQSFPDVETIIPLVTADKQLLQDYALVLEEKDREHFLELLPAEERKEASITIDRALSDVLRNRLIGDATEHAQRSSVQRRAVKNIEEAFQSAGDRETRGTVKILTETLRQLEAEDSARLLQELGTKGLAGAPDREHHLTKISYVARVITELGRIDRNKGNLLTMKLLSKREIPSRLFLFFMDALIEDTYLTKNTERYLSDSRQVPFIKKLIAQYPNQFNTVIDTLAALPDYDPSEHTEEVFGAIRDLDSLTPIIFNRYRQADDVGKRELAKKIRELRPKFFRNVPIKEILPKQDREILTEMVYLTYLPIGMSQGEVKRFIEGMEDRTEDLRRYRFPEEGYSFELTSQKAFTLKEGATVDTEILRQIHGMLGAEFPVNEGQIRQLAPLLERLVKGGTDFKPEELLRLLGLLGGDQRIRLFVDRQRDTFQIDPYNFLNEVKEIFGVYFNDHYWERLNNFLSANPAIESRLRKILANPERLATLKRKLGKEVQDDDWQKIEGRDTLAHILSTFLSGKVLKSTREAIHRNVNKFEEVGTGQAHTKTQTNLKAYISKNIGSFFAKASAGICTANDLELFTRKDHFHINVVENDQYVRANIQAYLIDEAGGKSLVLRGFNPNTDFVGKIDVAAFCEKVLEIARQFQQANNLQAVYITEGLGGWHALSNRTEVAQYLEKRYIKDKNKVSRKLQITGGKSVSAIYKV